MDQRGTLGGVKSLLACLMIGCLVLGVLAVLWQPAEAHASSTWETLTIDSATPRTDTWGGTSLAFDASGNPGIAYYDAATPVLKYAHWNGVYWAVETVAGGTNVGLGCSLAFDPSGNPAISYVDAPNAKLMYAHFDGSSWHKSEVGSTSDASNVDRCATETSLAFDPDGNPAISYRYYGMQYEGYSQLRYAVWGGTSWKVSIVDNEYAAHYFVGRYSSLAFNPKTGWPAIVYWDATADMAQYSWWDGEKWAHLPNHINCLADGVGYYNDLAFDASGNASVISYDHRFGKLFWVWQDKSTLFYFGDRAFVDAQGLFGSLALDSAGNPCVSYYDATYKNLKYAHFTGTYPTWWDRTIVDAEGDVGKWTSLALAPNGNPAISYYDVTNNKLKYAFITNPTVTMVDIPSFVDALLQITGTPADTAPGGVDKVQVMIGDTTAGKYWDGDSWEDTPSWLDATGTDTWSYDTSAVAFTDGHDYTVRAKAIDEAGYESAGASDSFTFEATAPGAGLSDGAIAGIIIGSLAGAGAIFLAARKWLWKAQ
jgi:hypothetical protein